MKNFLLLFLSLFVFEIAYTQKDVVEILIDTSTFHRKTNVNRWFKGDLDDTIIHYKKITVDSIICENATNICDTVFLIQYYDKGWRYINNKLHNTDYRKQQYGYLYKGKLNGFWNYTGSPSCFTNGTLIRKWYYYYNDVLLPGYFKDKYYFLNDSLSGFVMAWDSAIDTITDSIYYSCKKDESGKYNCRISIDNELFIKNVPLGNLLDETKSILSGYYNREIINKINKHNR